MNVARHFLPIKNIVLSAVMMIAAMALVIALWAPAVGAASGIVSVTSNIADVPGGDSFVMTVKVQDDGDVHHLEIDHSLESVLPEFKAYASESNPNGPSGSAGLDAYNASIIYSAADSQWVIDFGDITQAIIANGGEVAFYLTLNNASGEKLWGSMDNVAEWPSFSFNLNDGTSEAVEGTEYSLVDPADEDSAVVPGVPNTSVVRP